MSAKEKIPPKLSDMQSWNEQEFCEQYEKTWEISLDNIHYGWLAEGEEELGLLSDINLNRANVLDVGCGLGQNLIALAKRGAVGFGLDISSCMLNKANKIIKDAGFEQQITLENGDMRNFVCFDNVEYDLIISIYSMEYLKGVQELRSVIHNIYKRLKPGGVFILCYSHPSQAHRVYPELMNCSVPIGDGDFPTYNYSYKDTFEALTKAGFTIERVIEQKTKSPSKITYSESRKYPYHFREGCNPCSEHFDEISNGNPHTVVYKSRRHHEPLHGLPKQDEILIGYRELWGYKRSITKHTNINYLGLSFRAIFLAPMDNVVGLTDILGFSVTSYDLSVANSDIEIVSCSGYEVVKVPSNSILGLIHRKLKGLMLEPVYKVYSVDNIDNGKKEQRIFIQDMIGIGKLVEKTFKTTKTGLLTFVNGDEPSRGELPLDEVQAKPGDFVKLVYVALRENKLSKQQDLF